MGTFAYGDSYFGLRAFDQTNGAVKDAAASIAATVTIPPVAYKNAIGAAAAMTSTSSATAAAQQFVLKETWGYSYGTSAYGTANFGESYFNVPITTTASASITYRRVRLASISASVTSATAAIGGFYAQASATVLATCSVTPTSTLNGSRVRESAAQPAGASVTAAAAVARFVSASAVSVTSATAAVGQQFVLEETSLFGYGTAAYGMHAYALNADLQTVVSASSSATCTCDRIHQPTIAGTASCTVNASGRRVPEGSALVYGTATVTPTSTLNGSRVRTSGGAALPTAANDANCERVRELALEVTPASDVTANAVIIVSAAAQDNASASATVNGRFTARGFGAMSSASASQGAGQKVGERGGAMTSVVSINAHRAATFRGFGSTTALADNSGEGQRVRESNSVPAGTSVVVAVGRRKWEDIATVSITWGDSPVESVTWLKAA